MTEPRPVPLHPVPPRPPEPPQDWLYLPRAALRRTGEYTLFLVDYAIALTRNPIPFGRVMAEAYAIGVQSLPILAVISAFVGTNLAIQGYDGFRPLGGQRMVGMFVSLAGVRELGPIISASMVACKAGTEMASQIGVMKIREQLDALEVMSVNPYAWLVTPRLLGILLVLPPLTIIAIWLMIASGWAVAVFQLGINGDEYLHFATQGIRGVDFAYGVVKALIFGCVICTVSCYFGFTCGKGPEGVGQATNRAVVVSAVICVFINYFISEALYGGLG